MAELEISCYDCGKKIDYDFEVIEYIDEITDAELMEEVIGRGLGVEAPDFENKTVLFRFICDIVGSNYLIEKDELLNRLNKML